MPPSRPSGGGDISLFGPGGSIIVGSLAPEPNPKLKLRDLGILSLGGGAINSFTDANLLVNASRMLTVLGGDILAWSSNGNLDAGRGARTALSLPPLNVTFDSNDYQTIDASGLVSGSGIGVLQSTSFAQKSNVYLFAPRGIIDAGDAGIRSSGLAIVIAPVIANQGSITAAGGTNLPTIQAPNIAGITAPPMRPDRSRKSATHPRLGKRDQASIFIVEVIGYGGGDGDNDSNNNNDSSAGGNGSGGSQEKKKRGQGN